MLPAKNRTKQYLENSYYHIYNRGVEKRLIFLERQDYSVFLSYLKEYLLPKDEVFLRNQLSQPNLSSKERDKILKLLLLKNFYGEITLIAYCLMPNHFHFFLKQTSSKSIEKFIKSLCIRYTMYFNKKYKRVGQLCQDAYKAVLLSNDSQFIYLSKYIHKQALASQGLSLEPSERDQPSSYPDYLGKRKTEWVYPNEVLKYFPKKQRISYQAFINESEGILDEFFEDYYH